MNLKQRIERGSSPVDILPSHIATAVEWARRWKLKPAQTHRILSTGLRSGIVRMEKRNLSSNGITRFVPVYVDVEEEAKAMSKNTRKKR
jgi:hypothetical protein